MTIKYTEIQLSNDVRISIGDKFGRFVIHPTDKDDLPQNVCWADARNVIPKEDFTKAETWADSWLKESCRKLFPPA